MTISEYQERPNYDDEGIKLNEILLDGELFVSPAPSWTHGEVLDRMQEALTPALRKLGYKLVRERAVSIEEQESVPEPDLMIYRAADAALFYTEVKLGKNKRPWPSIPPLVAIEVWSPGNRWGMMHRIMQKMFSIGTQQFLVLDPKEGNPTVKYFQPAGTQNERALGPKDLVLINLPHVQIELDFHNVCDFSVEVDPAYVVNLATMTLD